MGEYTTIRYDMTNKIDFKCGKCEQLGDKHLRQIFESGGICHVCTQKIKMEKQEETIKNIHGPGITNISQVGEIKQKKYDKALENGFITTKTSWLEDIKRKGLEQYWEYLFDTIETADSPVEMRHTKCGNTYMKTPRSHLEQDNINTNGQGCTYCYHNSKRITKQIIEFEGNILYNHRFIYTNVPEIVKNNHEPIEIICVKHGLFKTSYTTHLSGAGGCLACSNKMKTKGELIELYNEVVKQNGVEMNLSEYGNNDIIKLSKNIECKCVKHMSHPVWMAILANVLKGSSCPTCVNKTEAKLFIYLHKQYPTTITQLKLESCKNKTYLPFDFCIPELNIIIELDGRQHFTVVSNWSSPEKSIKRDIFKMQKAAKLGYKIIRIFQEDVYNNNDNWLDENLLPEIKNNDRTHVYLSTQDTMYDEHIKLMNEGIEIVLSDSECEKEYNEIIEESPTKDPYTSL